MKRKINISRLSQNTKRRYHCIWESLKHSSKYWTEQFSACKRMQFMLEYPGYTLNSLNDFFETDDVRRHTFVQFAQRTDFFSISHYSIEFQLLTNLWSLCAVTFLRGTVLNTARFWETLLVLYETLSWHQNSSVYSGKYKTEDLHVLMCFFFIFLLKEIYMF